MRAFTTSKRHWQWACIKLVYIMETISAVQVSVTVDDKFGDEITGDMPVYHPQWSSQPDECSYCAAKPDIGQAHNGTWHDSTYTPGQEPNTIKYNFLGNAVDVYFIVAINVADAANTTNITFYIDGSYEGNYSYPYTSADHRDTYKYNVLGFQKEGLDERNHEVSITASGTEKSLVLFDYLVYTYNNDSSMSASLTTFSSKSISSTTTGASQSTIALAGASSGGTWYTYENSASLLQESSSSELVRTNSVMSAESTLSAHFEPGGNGSLASSQDSSSSRNISSIAGGVIGAFALVVLAAVFFCISFRRRRRREGSNSPIRPPSFANNTDLDIPVPNSSRSSIEKDPFPYASSSCRPSESVYERHIPLDKKESWNRQHSLPPSICGYGVGLNNPSETRRHLSLGKAQNGL